VAHPYDHKLVIPESSKQQLTREQCKLFMAPATPLAHVDDSTPPTACHYLVNLPLEELVIPMAIQLLELPCRPQAAASQELLPVFQVAPEANDCGDVLEQLEAYLLSGPMPAIFLTTKSAATGKTSSNGTSEDEGYGFSADVAVMLRMDWKTSNSSCQMDGSGMPEAADQQPQTVPLPGSGKGIMEAAGGLMEAGPGTWLLLDPSAAFEGIHAQLPPGKVQHVNVIDVHLQVIFLCF
jgi:hypothetical protein